MEIFVGGPPAPRRRRSVLAGNQWVSVPDPVPGLRLTGDRESESPSSPSGDTAQDAQDEAAENARPQLFLGTEVVDLDIFPDYIRGAIQRVKLHDRNASSVSMRFLDDEEDGAVRCILSMDVLPSKVERIAMLLFGAQLEIYNGLRELVLPNGVTANVEQLQGARIETVRQVLGENIARGVETSSVYLYERSVGAVSTRAVSMFNFTNPFDGAFITMELGLPIAVQIFQKLYPI